MLPSDYSLSLYSYFQCSTYSSGKEILSKSIKATQASNSRAGKNSDLVISANVRPLEDHPAPRKAFIEPNITVNVRIKSRSRSISPTCKAHSVKQYTLMKRLSKLRTPWHIWGLHRMKLVTKQKVYITT